MWYKCIFELELKYVGIYRYGDEISQGEYDLLSPKQQKHFLKQ